MSLGTWLFYIVFSFKFHITQTYSACFSLPLLSFHEYIHDDHSSTLIAYSPSGHDIPYTCESPRLTLFCCYIFRRYSLSTNVTDLPVWYQTYSVLLIWYRMLCGDILVLLSLSFFYIPFCGTKLCQDPFYGTVYVYTSAVWYSFVNYCTWDMENFVKTMNYYLFISYLLIINI